MKQRPRRPTLGMLSDVRSRFERWRRTRTRGTRIPAALWQAAVEAARAHGVSKTAQELSLDYYGLKKRLESSSIALPTPSPGRDFVEIALPSTAPECVMEFENGQGARLRVEFKGTAPAQLETLARTLWSLAR